MVGQRRSRIATISFDQTSDDHAADLVLCLASWLATVSIENAAMGPIVATTRVRRRSNGASAPALFTPGSCRAT